MALSKTGRFHSKAEILGVGVFSPLSKRGFCSMVSTPPEDILTKKFKFVLLFSCLKYGLQKCAEQCKLYRSAVVCNPNLLSTPFCMSKGRKNDELFAAQNGPIGTPIFDPELAPKSLRGSLLRVQSQEMRDIDFFLGAFWMGGKKKFVLKKFMCFSIFAVLIKFRRVTIRGALRGTLPLRGLCEGLSEGSVGSLRGFCGALRGSAGVHRIFRGFGG